MDRYTLPLALCAALLAGCRKEEDSNSISELAAAPLSESPTVVRVTWRTASPDAGYVTFSVEGEPERRTPVEAEPTTEHEALLVGLPAESSVSFEVSLGDGSATEAGSVSTGTLPEALPTFALEGAPDDRWRSIPLLDASTDDVHVVVLDPQYRIVWSHVDTRGSSVFRSRVRRDGTGVWYASTLIGGEPAESSAIVSVSWDGTEQVFPVPWLAHDFVELQDGTIATLVYETRDEVQGNAIVLLKADGSTEVAWSTFDCFDPAIHTGDDPEHGWTHTNALDYDEARDTFIVGMRNLGTIVEVDRGSGTCGDAFGGTGGTVALDGSAFYHQHQFERIPSGLLVFDNDGAPGNESRVLEYSYTQGDTEAVLLRTFRADPPLYSFILGDVYRSADQQTTITWSVEGVIDRYDIDGQRTMRVTPEPKYVLGFTHTLADPYDPE